MGLLNMNGTFSCGMMTSLILELDENLLLQCYPLVGSSGEKATIYCSVLGSDTSSCSLYWPGSGVNKRMGCFLQFISSNRHSIFQLLTVLLILGLQ